MGGVFSRGLLKLGHPVIPVTRQMNPDAVANKRPDPLLVLVTVAENDLHPVLEKLPAAWRDRVGLVQNELLPRDWRAHDIAFPTVVAVWFEKKKGQDVKVLVPSPVHGPNARLLVDALAALDIPAWKVPRDDELLFELVRKNVYILTTNIAGLVVGGTVDALWNKHRDLALEVANDVMDIQFALIGSQLDRDALIAGMVTGIEGDPAHQCTGRSAPARLARAIAHADAAGLPVPRLRAIAAKPQ
jgi:ketopantoate reductase